MDRAVLDAYGWADIRHDCQFLLEYEESDNEELGGRGKKPWRLRWPDEIRDEVLARLLALNAERAAEEERAGIGVRIARKLTSGTARVTRKPTGSLSSSFFDDHS
jgi:hypothetical protein